MYTHKTHKKLGVDYVIMSVDVNDSGSLKIHMCRNKCRSDDKKNTIRAPTLKPP